jgi:hypothetical protein
MAKSITEILSYLAEFPENMSDAMRIIDDTQKYNYNVNQFLIKNGLYDKFIKEYYSNITIPKGEIIQ